MSEWEKKDGIISRKSLKTAVERKMYRNSWKSGKGDMHNNKPEHDTQSFKNAIRKHLGANATEKEVDNIITEYIGGNLVLPPGIDRDSRY